MLRRKKSGPRAAFLDGHLVDLTAVAAETLPLAAIVAVPVQPSDVKVIDVGAAQTPAAGGVTV